MNNQNYDLAKLMAVMVTISIAFLMSISLASCTKTIYVQGESKTEYVYQERIDTTYHKDSVYIKEVIKGDTIRLTEYRWRDRFRYISTTDTIYQCDSCIVQVPVEVVRYDHKMNGCQRFFFWFGIVAMIGIIGYVWYRLKKFKKSFMCV